ncbi:hypothetical protein SAMN05216525_13329 [Bradyrhizobium sp. Gha]|nr:hypothetical protein SAMN05216525_13329 [Bradyrhizobium sp. Gha]
MTTEPSGPRLHGYVGQAFARSTRDLRRSADRAVIFSIMQKC